MRALLSLSLLLAALSGAAAQSPANPVVARVEGEEIRLSDVEEAAANLPEELRGAPPAMLYPLLLDQLIAQKAIVAAARARGLERDPGIARRIAAATEEVLSQALLRQEIEPALAEDSLRARYTRDLAGRAPEEEIRARHILVPTEAEARTALAEARRPGADFAEVARRHSTGPGAREGGDLGFFKRSDMIPEFAEAAFAMRAGEISTTPVRSPFGWHVIKVEERRSVAPPAFEEVRDAIRAQAFEEAVNQAVARFRDAARVERFNLDGSAPRPPSALDGAAPPPPATAPRR